MVNRENININVIRYLSKYTVHNVDNIYYQGMYNNKVYIQLSDIYIGKLLGDGGNSQVYEAYIGDDILLVIKKINIRESIAFVLQEALIHQVLNHPNIVKLVDYFADDEILYIIMEHGNGPDLFDYLNQHNEHHVLPETICRDLFKQMISAVEECHSRNIIHSDIKLENFVFFNDRLKLIDFGCSFIKTGIYQVRRGTLNHFAPEMITGSSYDASVDIWALGVTLYEMATGLHPFDNDDGNDTHLKNNIKYVIFRKPKNLSHQLTDLINKILVFDKNERLSLEKIKTHPWLNMID